MESKIAQFNGSLTHQSSHQLSNFQELAMMFGWATIEETITLTSTFNLTTSPKNTGILILKIWEPLINQL